MGKPAYRRAVATVNKWERIELHLLTLTHRGLLLMGLASAAVAVWLHLN